MNKAFENKLQERLRIHKTNILEEINATARSINIDFAKLEEDLKNLINDNEKIKGLYNE